MSSAPIFNALRTLVLFLFGILLIPVSHCRADAEPKQLDQVRQQFLVRNNEAALDAVQAYIKTATDMIDKQVATILEAHILMLSKGKGDDASQELMNGFKPDSSNPRVQAELLRLKACQARRDPANEMAAWQELLKTYPGQFSGYDLYDMTEIALKTVVNKFQRKHFTKEIFAPAAARLGNSPLVPLSKTFLMHWKDNAPEGVAMMRQAEKELQEPLLSLAREKELSFLHGNFDNRDRVEQAKAIAHQIIQANQVDIHHSFNNIMVMVRSRKEPDAMAKWLEAEAKTAPTPEAAAILWAASLNEYLDIGMGDGAKQVVADAGAAKMDPKTLQSMQTNLEKLVWQIQGQIPKSWLAPDRKWIVEAVESQMAGATGKLLASTSTTPDASGKFSLTVVGAKMMALLAYTRPANSMPILRVLAEDVKAGTPITIDESKYVRHALAAPAVTDPNAILLHERFGKDWQPQLIQLHLPKQAAVNPDKLRVVDSHNQSLLCQYLGDDDKSTIVGVWRGLKPNEQETLKVIFDGGSIPVAAPPGVVKVSTDGTTSQVVDTGVAQFKIPAGSARNLPAGDAAKYAFLLGARGPDGVWRGKPGWVGDSPPVSVRVSRALNGPIRTSFVVDYEFANGAKRAVTLSFDAGQPVMLIDEKGDGDFPGEFQFQFVPEDGFDTFAEQLRPGRDMEKLAKRTPELGFHLGDYPYFSANISGMLAGVLSSKPDMKDFVALFVVHAGNWFDPSYKEAFTPIDLNPEAHWLNPFRYTGSINSSISGTVVQNGALTYAIPVTPGIRRWGVAVIPHDTIKKGPQNTWDSQYLADRYNQGDLSVYAAMTLQWTSPLEEHGALRDQIRDRLLHLQSLTGKGLYKASCDAVENERPLNSQWAILMGVQEDDPAMIWLGWHQLAGSFSDFAHQAAGLETDPYTLNPVGCRGVPNMLMGYIMADELGMLTDEDRAQCRANAALTVYRLWSPDFMNWHMNCGQPNFELDRLDQVLSFADTFPGHPAAKEMHEHVVRQTKEALRQYTIRDGGKWAENAGNYYLYSFELLTRIAVGLQLNGGLEDLVSSPYFEPFCRFHMNIVLGRMPPDTSWLKDEDTSSIPMDQWVRFTLGIGSHSGDGGRRIDQYALLMAQTIQQQNSGLANDLFALWKSGGNYFINGRGPDLLIFGKPDMPDVPVFTPQPVRMPGFGVVMRDGVNTDREFCLTFHVGPSGYRDEPGNGGITLNALGRPLSLMGGEGSGAGGRTGLLFDSKNEQGFGGMPMGHITRWLVSDAVEYGRGDFTPPRPILPGATDRLPGSSKAFDILAKIKPGDAPPEKPQLPEKPRNPNAKPVPIISRDILFARNDYVVFQDQHNQPEQGYFNLATPAESVEQTAQGTLCHGKLGVDVWLVPLVKGKLPAAVDPPEDMSYGEERATEAEMWHQLSVRIPIQQFSDMLLCPVPAGDQPPKTESLGQNVWHISGDSFDDVLFTGNATQQVTGVGSVAFQGEMGLLRRSGRGWSFSMVNGTSVSISGRKFTSGDPETIFYDGTAFHEVAGDNQPKK